MERDVVAGGVEGRQVDQFDGQVLRQFGSHVRIVRHDTHLEGLGPLDHFAADAAQADDAERLAAQLIAHELLLFPLAGAGGGAGLRDAARHGEHEGEGVLGDRDGVAAGCIHDQHAGFGGGVEIDVIHPHAGAPDDAQFRRLFQHRGVHLHGAAHQQRVGFRQVLGIFLGIGNDDVPTGLGPE